METTINNYGTIIMNGQPPKRKTWKHTLRIGRLYFSISNVKTRKACCRGSIDQKNRVKDLKRAIYNEHEGKCPVCGQQFEFHEMEVHHILPWYKFPELREDKRNLEVLCVNCHRELHQNPFRMLATMQAKAAELGINLEERYELLQH